MKKVSFAFSVVLMASLLLAACGGGSNNATQGTPGALGTSDAGTIPNTGTTATMMVTEPSALGTATMAAPLATGTMDAGANALATETPSAAGTSSVGAVTGTPSVDLGNQPDRLSALLGYEVRNATGDVIGEVNGLLVNRSNVVSENMTGSDNTSGATQTTGTPAAGGVATGTPASGTGTGTTMTSGQGGAQIAYVVVELNDAFNGGATGKDTTGSTGTQTTTTPVAGGTTGTAMPSTTQTVSGLAGDNTGTGTAMAGDSVLMPLAAFQPLMVGSTTSTTSTTTGSNSEDKALVLAIDETALASAPVFDRNKLDFTMGTWNADYQAFWMGQGLSIPVTGGETGMATETVLFEDGFDAINATNTNKDDLGNVKDFIINPTTGEFRYAILAAGGFLGIGEKYIPVPMSMVSWMADDATTGNRDVTKIGKVLINVPEDTFKNAPSFDAINMMDTTTTTWDTDITSFWQTFDTGSSK